MKVQLKNIRFAYNNSASVLEGISFNVSESKAISIVGASGCGKSTLLRIIAGILPSSKRSIFSGEVVVGDIDIVKQKDKWLKCRQAGRLGFMFQEPNLMPFLNVKDNIHLPLKITGKTRNEEVIVRAYLELTGLSKHAEKLPEELSGGMKTRVALARTFITRPTLLLLDEPFGALDIIWKSKLYEEVRNLKTQMNTTVLLVTHDIFEAIFFSDTIIVLGRNKRIVETVIVNSWKENFSYDEVITNFYNVFVYIKKLIEAH